jgi:hypothetical protein
VNRTATTRKDAFRRLIVIATFATLCVPALGAADSPNTTLDEVLVTGEQPGPGLWKISKGDHVLWIFGSYSPLPKKMSWRSKEVETIVAESQELITAVDIKPNIGFFTGLTLLPSLIGIRNNPGGAKLKDVVPDDLYARWLVQKDKYIGQDKGIEKWRPSFAAGELFAKAVEQLGFKPQDYPPTDAALEVVEKIAKKHKVKITTPTVPVDVEKPRAWIKEFKKSPLDDLACFSATLKRLETDLDLLRSRANAWAIGNVAALRPQVYIEQQDACFAAFMTALKLEGAQQRGFQDIPARIVQTWVAAVETALTRNSSTFAVLSIDDIFRKDGYVEALRKKGYAIEEP